MNLYMNHVTKEMMEQERREVLHATQQDIRNLAGIVEQVLREDRSASQKYAGYLSGRNGLSEKFCGQRPGYDEIHHRYNQQHGSADDPGCQGRPINSVADKLV